MHRFFQFSLIRLPLFTLLFFAAAVQAQVARYVDGVHYTTLPETASLKTPATNPPKSEVLEVFWYGCGSCNALDPLLNDWVAAHADDVSFSRSPMIWNDSTEQHARVFFAAQQLNVLEQLHEHIFAAIHQQRNTLLDESSVAALFAQHGVDAEAFSAAWRSFAVDAGLRKAQSMQRELGVRAVPALVVDGRWLVQISAAVPSHVAMLDVAGFLLGKHAGE